MLYNTYVLSGCSDKEIDTSCVFPIANILQHESIIGKNFGIIKILIGTPQKGIFR